MEAPRFFTAGGIETRYYEAGAGEPLVLLHGGQYGAVSASCAEDWEPVFDGLARRFRVIALDMLGQGFTANPRTDDAYVIGSTVGHVVAFMNRLGIEKAHLAGHSRGGYTALRMAMEHPDRVLTVIDVSSASFIQEVMHHYAEVRRQAEQYDDPRMWLRAYLTGNSYAGEHVTDGWLDVKLQIKDLPERQATVEKMRRLGEQFSDDIERRQRECREWVEEGRLVSPTLIAWGYNDPTAGWGAVGLKTVDLVLSNNPNSRAVVFNQAGHYCYREQPKAFVAAVGGFVESLG